MNISSTSIYVLNPLEQEVVNKALTAFESHGLFGLIDLVSRSRSWIDMQTETATGSRLHAALAMNAFAWNRVLLAVCQSVIIDLSDGMSVMADKRSLVQQLDFFSDEAKDRLAGNGIFLSYLNGMYSQIAEVMDRKI